MASEDRTRPELGRRGFLGALAGISAGAAALAGAGAVSEARAQTSTEDRKRARYQETDHVLRFYETNRY